MYYTLWCRLQSEDDKQGVLCVYYSLWYMQTLDCRVKRTTYEYSVCIYILAQSQKTKSVPQHLPPPPLHQKMYKVFFVVLRHKTTFFFVVFFCRQVRLGQVRLSQVRLGQANVQPCGEARISSPALRLGYGALHCAAARIWGPALRPRFTWRLRMLGQ